MTRIAEAIVPPGPPMGLAATVIGTTVVLTWAPPTTGGAPTSYVIQAGSAPGLSNLADVNTGSALPTVTATNVSPGTYFVRVLAQDAGGTSAPSNEIVVTVLGSCGAPPGAPTGLFATVSGTTVGLIWQAAASGCPATSYVIQAGSAPGLSNLANSSTGSAAPSFTANSVAPGAYYVRVLAANATGTSATSNEIVLVVSACSGPPGAPSGLAALVSSSTVTLSWTAAAGSPATYLIDVGSSPGSSNIGVIDNGAATSFAASGVAAGTYHVQVRATNACGAGPASNQIVVVVSAVPPVTLTILHAFTGPDGLVPGTALVQGMDGNFYGTTNTTGVVGTNQTTPGNVYRVTPAGSFTVVHAFTGADGGYSSAPLIQASDGNFYGTTSGTVFRMTPAGAVTVLHVFAGGNTDGAFSMAGVIQARDGNAYGTTASGGAGYGTVFRMTPGGTVSVFYAFSGGADGYGPRAPLIQANDGNFYGTAYYAGASNRGTVFKLTPGGTFTLLHTFTGGADGGFPSAGLIQGADGNLYGTASTSGGSTFRGGTVFRLDLAGNFTVLHTFTDVDGEVPNAELLQASDGNFYGTTSGGISSRGTVFVMTPAGALTVLHPFAGGIADGASPSAALIQASDGNLYGTTTRGGASDVGTVFRISR